MITTPEITPAMIESVKQAAWRDHPDDIEPGGTFFRHGVTRVATPADVEVISVEPFDRVYSFTPTHFATVTVRYAEQGPQAIYALRTDGGPVLYAN